jgi:hypothetical protein
MLLNKLKNRKNSLNNLKWFTLNHFKLS